MTSAKAIPTDHLEGRKALLKLLIILYTNITIYTTFIITHGRNIYMANGRLEKVEILNEADGKKRIKREFFLSKKLFNEIVEDIAYGDDYTNFSMWVFDACKSKLANKKGADKKQGGYMTRTQIENMYLANGLKDFRLHTTEDLLKVHGIDFKRVDGYDRLDDLNKAVYEKFIINFFNGQGLDYRDIVPKGIYFVEEVNFLVKENPTDNYYTVAGGKVLIIDKNGLKTVHEYWLHNDYKDLEVTEGKPNIYLRFEYKHQGVSEWLHVINEKKWY